MTNNVSKCGYYKKESQNVKSRFKCVLPTGSRNTIPIEKEKCEVGLFVLNIFQIWFKPRTNDLVLNFDILRNRKKLCSVMFSYNSASKPFSGIHYLRAVPMPSSRRSASIMALKLRWDVLLWCSGVIPWHCRQNSQENMVEPTWSPLRVPPLEPHDKGSQTRLGHLNYCDPIAWQ